MNARWLGLGVLFAAGCTDFLLVKGELPTTAVAQPADLGDVQHLQYYAMAGLLDLHVVDDGSTTSVQYSELLDSPEALHTLQNALDQLAGVDLLTLDGPDERLAFVLNLYNLHVVAGVLQERAADPTYDTVSVGDFVFFHVPRVALGGRTLTLDQLEHAVLRGVPSNDLAEEDRELFNRWHTALWDGAPVDARIHVGLNCSARSCPALPMEVFRAATVDDQLEASLTVLPASRGSSPGASAGVGVSRTW